MSTGKATDDTTTVQNIKNAYVQFRKERDWDQYNTPRSITLEAAELLEHFQWETEEETKDQAELASELADIVGYCLQFADVTGIDLTTALYTKLEHLKERYPAKTLRASSSLDDYYKIKETHRANGKGKTETS
jgi:dCTP diphosphatase